MPVEHDHRNAACAQNQDLSRPCTCAPGWKAHAAPLDVGRTEVSYGPNCELRIIGIEHVTNDDLPLLLASVTKARQHLHSPGGSATLWINARNKQDWLEYGLHITYGSGGRLFIGCIQRDRTKEPEFHT